MPANAARRLWAPAFYLFFYAAGAALIPFLPVYYEDLGLSGSQIGLLTGLPPLVMLFGASLWSALADATQRHRAIMALGILGAVASTLMLSQAQAFLWLPPLIIAQAFFAAPIVPLADKFAEACQGEYRAAHSLDRSH